MRKRKDDLSLRFIALNFQNLNTFSATTVLYQKVLKIKFFNYAWKPTLLVVWGILLMTPVLLKL